MSVARCLGVETDETPLMLEARSAWSRWCDDDPSLRLVDDLVDLRSWMRGASKDNADAILATLLRLAHQDHAAAVAVAWLLRPGIVTLARRLGDLSPDIDAVIAGQVWIEITTGLIPATRVAAAVLGEVRRGVLAELGVGRAGARRDPTWASTDVRRDMPDMQQPLSERPDVPDGSELLSLVVQQAVGAGAITETEAGFLLGVAEDAHYAYAPGRRGRGGLTTPWVLTHTAQLRGLSQRTIRRKVTEVLDRLTAYAREHVDLGELERWYETHEHGTVDFATLVYLYDDIAVEQMRASEARSRDREARVASRRVPRSAHRLGNRDERHGSSG